MSELSATKAIKMMRSIRSRLRAGTCHDGKGKSAIGKQLNTLADYVEDCKLNDELLVAYLMTFEWTCVCRWTNDGRATFERKLAKRLMAAHDDFKHLYSFTSCVVDGGREVLFERRTMTTPFNSKVVISSEAAAS